MRKRLEPPSVNSGFSAEVKATKIMLDPLLPPHTMIVSRDLWDEIQRQNNKPTLEGEVVREAKKQLEDGDGRD